MGTVASLAAASGWELSSPKGDYCCKPVAALQMPLGNIWLRLRSLVTSRKEIWCFITGCPSPLASLYIWRLSNVCLISVYKCMFNVCLDAYLVSWYLSDVLKCLSPLNSEHSNYMWMVGSLKASGKDRPPPFAWSEISDKSGGNLFSAFFQVNGAEIAKKTGRKISHVEWEFVSEIYLYLEIGVETETCFCANGNIFACKWKDICLASLRSVWPPPLSLGSARPHQSAGGTQKKRRRSKKRQEKRKSETNNFATSWETICLKFLSALSFVILSCGTFTMRNEDKSEKEHGSNATVGKLNERRRWAKSWSWGEARATSQRFPPWSSHSRTLVHTWPRKEQRKHFSRISSKYSSDNTILFSIWFVLIK